MLDFTLKSNKQFPPKININKPQCNCTAPRNARAAQKGVGSQNKAEMHPVNPRRFLNCLQELDVMNAECAIFCFLEI